MRIPSANCLLLVSLLSTGCFERPGADAPPDSMTRLGPAKAHVDALARYRLLETQALAGHADAQRQLADWLGGGNQGRPPVNPVVGCAWRLVVLDRAEPASMATDLADKERQCEKRLVAADLQAARIQSDALRRRMRGSEDIAAR